MRRTLRLVSLAGFLALTPPAPLPAQSTVSPAALDSLLDRAGGWKLFAEYRARRR
jgi:hypothetical protein